MAPEGSPSGAGGEHEIGLYARVSRADGAQDVDNQLHELRGWAARLGGEVVQEFVDKVSGAKNADDRPALRRALEAAHRRDYDLLLIWSLDRLSRAGVLALAGILERLKTAGIGEGILDHRQISVPERLGAVAPYGVRPKNLMFCGTVSETMPTDRSAHGQANFWMRLLPSSAT